MAATNNSIKKIFSINLLIHKGDQPKIYIKFIKWLLSSGRFIVIFVEILVISAFVFRYKIDMDIADLQEQIEGQIPYLESLKEDETKIRQVQFQLTTIKNTHRQSPDYLNALSNISKLTPQNIILNSITINQDPKIPQPSLTIQGAAFSSLEVSAYIKALQNNPNFTGISLTNISFEENTAFTINGHIKNTGGKN